VFWREGTLLSAVFAMGNEWVWEPVVVWLLLLVSIASLFVQLLLETAHVGHRRIDHPGLASQHTRPPPYKPRSPSYLLSLQTIHIEDVLLTILVGFISLFVWKLQAVEFHTFDLFHHHAQKIQSEKATVDFSQLITSFVLAFFILISFIYFVSTIRPSLKNLTQVAHTQLLLVSLVIGELVLFLARVIGIVSTGGLQLAISLFVWICGLALFEYGVKIGQFRANMFCVVILPIQFSMAFILKVSIGERLLNVFTSLCLSLFAISLAHVSLRRMSPILCRITVVESILIGALETMACVTQPSGSNSQGSAWIDLIIIICYCCCLFNLFVYTIPFSISRILQIKTATTAKSKEEPKFVPDENGSSRALHRLNSSRQIVESKIQEAIRMIDQLEMPRME
jgi:hypothetical protein